MAGRLKTVLESWEPVIGLEVHVQLATESKIFCGCSTTFGAEPNRHTCPVCLGHPGVLPVLNRRVAELAARLGLALGCEVRRRSIWARKNYFYPDLPKGYQISQFELPVCEHGELEYELDDGEVRRTSIVRIHMEEDAGKNVHLPGADHSLVDLNRAGVPLLEIVSGPDLRAPEEAAAYLRALRSIVRYLDISDGNMQEGSLRCDANVSLRRRGTEPFGTRAEIKNLNSFRFVQKAIEHEVLRQAVLLENGEPIVQETRLYDPDRDETRSMRSKEEAHDYRYFPDPDLPPLVLSDALLAGAEAAQVELPLARSRRYRDTMGLSLEESRVLTAEREVAELFEAAVAAYAGEPKKMANWVQTEVLRELKERDVPVAALGLEPAQLAALQSRVDDATLSSSVAKDVFAEMLASGETPDAIIEAKGLKQVSDTGELEAVVRQVLADHPEQAATYRGGKKGILSFLMGQVMKATRGKANPKLASELLRAELEKEG